MILVSGHASAESYSTPAGTVHVVQMEEAFIGDELDLELRFDLDGGWKTYHPSTPGGTQPRFLTPGGEEIGPETIRAEWPDYEVLDFYGERIHGYTDDISVPLAVDLDAFEGQPSIRIDFELFYCSNQCIRDSIEVKLPNPRSGGGISVPPQW